MISESVDGLILVTAESIAVETILSYLEPGMYLIAACLPSLRIVIMQVKTILSESVESLRGWHRSLGRSVRSREALPSQESRDSELHRLRHKIDIDLTGQGNLDSLARAGHSMMK